MLVAMEIDIRVSYFYSLEFDRCQLSVESFVLTQTRVIISKDKTIEHAYTLSLGWKKNSCSNIYIFTLILYISLCG